MQKQKVLVYILVSMAMLCWSLTYIWYKVVFTALGPMSVMTFRLSFSAILMFLFAYFAGKLNKVHRSDIKWFALLSFFQPFLYFLFEGYGVSKVSATLASVIIATIPVFTPFIARLFFSERLSIFNYLGIILSFIGVTLVSLGRQLQFNGSPLGILLLFGAVASSLGYVVLIVKLTTRYNSFTIIGWQNMFGALFFIPLFFIFEFPTIQLQAINIRIILNLIYLSVFGSTIAYILFTYSIKKIGITRSSLFTNIIPVFTGIFSYWFLDEHLDIWRVLGIVIVLTGLFLSQIKRYHKV
jgi:drug/metabolite transporter (DMT)-like permease